MSVGGVGGDFITKRTILSMVMVGPFRPGLWEAQGGDLAASSRDFQESVAGLTVTQTSVIFFLLFVSTLENEVCTIFLNPKAVWRIHTNLYPNRSRFSVGIILTCIGIYVSVQNTFLDE